MDKSEKRKESDKTYTWQQKLLLDFRDMLYVLAAFLVIFVLFFRVVMVDGDSMYDTLVDGDRLILISNVLYQKPQQGDIIVANVVRDGPFENGGSVIKRVIATEGQVVVIENGRVYVDGEVLDEAYVDVDTVVGNEDDAPQFPLVVGEGKVFVLGDNRGISMDSRSKFIGLIDEREILGKAFFLMLPGTDDTKNTTDYHRIGVVD